jgi:hypothetical protein
MEGIVRPFIVVTSDPSVDPAAAGPPRETPPAYIRWGAASSFDSGFRDLAAQNTGFDTIEKPLPTIFGRYNEEARAWTDFKVINPEDNSQFVIVRKINEIAFKAIPESSFIADPRQGEQVTFTFQNDFEAHGERYLKNSAGDDFDAVVLDPFTQIVEVGWAGDFAILVMTWEPAITGLGSSGATFPQLFFKTPSSIGGVDGADVKALGINAGSPDSIYPNGESDPKKQWMALIMEASWPGEDESAHGTSSRFVSTKVFYLNLKNIRSGVADDLHSHGDSNFQIGWKYGGSTKPGDQQGSPIAYLGYSIYPGSVLPSLLAHFNENLNTAVLAMGLASRTAQSVMDTALGILGDAKDDGTLAHQPMTDQISALPPTETFFGDHYRFDDNYPNVLEPW